MRNQTLPCYIKYIQSPNLLSAPSLKSKNKVLSYGDMFCICHTSQYRLQRFKINLYMNFLESNENVDKMESESNYVV